MQKVPFYKPSIGESEIQEVVDTLRGGWLTTGPKTKKFEEEFSAFIQQPYSVALNSCTAALHLALEAVGLKPGQAVVVPTMTFAATAEVVRYFGAIPLLADCRPDDLNIDVDHARVCVESALARGLEVVAIIPVHYAGQMADMAGIRRLANRFQLKIIEDAAHCCPGFYREDTSSPWKPVGTDADISCFSFYANKNLTTGEGGMACTASQEYADRIRMMSLHGISRDAWKRYTADGSWYYEIVAPGYKYNLTDIASSIGLHQLRRARTLHSRRSELAELYSELLKDVTELILPFRHPNRIHSWHLYPVRVQSGFGSIDRGAVIAELKTVGIGSSVHWLPLHMHPYYRDRFGMVPADCPQAASIYPELLSLPLYPEMTMEQLIYVCSNLKRILTRSRSQVSVAETILAR